MLLEPQQAERQVAEVTAHLRGGRRKRAPASSLAVRQLHGGGNPTAWDRRRRDQGMKEMGVVAARGGETGGRARAAPAARVGWRWR